MDRKFLFPKNKQSARLVSRNKSQAKTSEKLRVRTLRESESSNVWIRWSPSHFPEGTRVRTLSIRVRMLMGSEVQVFPKVPRVRTLDMRVRAFMARVFKAIFQRAPEFERSW
ncbi:hypothetical protein AAC387_Pa08g1520 [Persea americana]